MFKQLRPIVYGAVAAAAALALTAARPADAQGKYTITEMRGLPGYAYDWTWQQTINNWGVVAAYANNGDSPGTFANPGLVDPNAYYDDASYLWYDGRIVPLPGLPGSVDTIAFALNNVGQVVGRSTLSGIPNQPVLWDNGVISALSLLPGDNKGGALMINDSGRICGYSQNTVTSNRRAVTWFWGTVTQLTSLGKGVYDDALGINERGEIAGYSTPTGAPGEHVTRWDNGKAHDLGTLGGPWGDGYAINSHGEITGISATALQGGNGFGDAFLYMDGLMIDLGVFPGDALSCGLSINDRGQVVGFSESATDPLPTHAMLWDNGEMINLQTRIPARSGWTLIAAGGINDNGQIVGTGIIGGKYRNFVLTPTGN